MKFEQNLCREQFYSKYWNDVYDGEKLLDDDKDTYKVFSAISKLIASKEKKKNQKFWENEFFNLIESKELIPAGRFLANARPNNPRPQMNNCFTIGIKDSIQDIYQSLKDDATISSLGGGVGFNVSSIRPAGEMTSNGGIASGPISFLEVFNESAKIITVAGHRRGAHIAILNIDHPDIESFITCKQGDINKTLTQFNISVGITDKFMEAVKRNDDWNLIFNNKVYKVVKARYLLDLLLKNMYEHNEPGILFLDNVNRLNPVNYGYKIEATNPCGEQPLGNYNCCNLSSINLTSFVIYPFAENVFPENNIDWKGLAAAIEKAVRFLDNAIDITIYPIPEIEKNAKLWRRVGLGFTGFGDMLAMLRVPYSSIEAETISRLIASTFFYSAISTSARLAKEKGVFPKYDKKKFMNTEFFKTRIAQSKNLVKLIEKYGVRNSAWLTVPPVGTGSLTLGQNCSSGIEPIFALEYERKVRKNAEEIETSVVMDYAWKLYKDMGLYKDNVIPEFFETTQNIPPEKHIEIQAIFQSYFDSSISKTINLPDNCSFEDFSKLFFKAYELGLKGYTTFNPNGSLKGILSVKPEAKDPVVSIKRTDAPKRPKELPAKVYEITIKAEKYLIIIGMLHGSVYEVFIMNKQEAEEWEGYNNANPNAEYFVCKKDKGKYSLEIKDQDKNKVIITNINKYHEYEGPTRLLSTALRHGTPLEYLVDQLSKSSAYGSWGKAVVKVLKMYASSGEKINNEQKCPTCAQATLVYKEGCISCSNCGWSKCD